MSEASGSAGVPGKVTGLRRLFIRKSVAQMHAEHAQSDLKRSLGALNLVLLGIGCIIGTGIFVLTGRAAANFAGPGIMISFIITGLLCTFVALCYAELASAVPVSGSAYSYSYAAMGELAAWIMGLLLVLEYGLAAATVAVGWSGYLVSLLQDVGIHIAPAFTAAPGVEIKEAGVVVATGIINLPAALAILAVTALLVIGISESTTVNNIVVAIKLSVVIAFIVIGSFYVNPDLWVPLVPAEIPPPPAGTPRGFWADIWRALVDVVTAQNTSRYGIGGLIAGAATIFFAYIGFEAVSTAGAESRNPARDMPIGILGSLVICTVLYILTAAVLVGIVPYTELDDPAPIAKAVNLIGLPWFAILVKVGAIAGLSSVMLVLLYGQTRIFYTMARDGLLPAPLAAVHPKFRTPWINTLIVGSHCRGLCRTDVARFPRRPDQRRFAGCIRHRLHHRALPALRGAGAQAPVPDALLPDYTNPRGPDVPLPADVADGECPHPQLLPDLPGRRDRRLLPLRNPALQAGQGRDRDRRRTRSGPAKEAGRLSMGRP